MKLDPPMVLGWIILSVQVQILIQDQEDRAENLPGGEVNFGLTMLVKWAVMSDT